MQNFRFLLFALSFVSLTACRIDVETVEARDEQGRKIRFERRKKDAAKQGLFQRFYDNGVVAEEAMYKNDTLDGVRKYFYPSGITETLENYKNGVLHGVFQKFYDNGILQVEQSFENGAMQGISLAYYPNGVLREKVTIKNNEEEGPFTEYYPNGQLQAQGTYVPGDDGPLEQGELKEYNESGELIRTAQCNKGVCLTTWKKE